MSTLEQALRLNYGLRDVQNVCALTNVGTVLKYITVIDQLILDNLNLLTYFLNNQITFVLLCN